MKQATASIVEALTESVDCPICSSRQFTVIRPAQYPSDLSAERLADIFKSSSDTELLDQLVRCADCGLVYLNPRIRSDIIVDAYADACDPRFAAQNPMRIASFHKCFSNWLRRFGISPSQDRKVLDIGCAGGAFPKAAADMGFSVTGVEPSRYLSSGARTEYGLDIRTGTLREQSFANATFDVVTLWDVVEHLSDPVGALNDIRAILKDDGYLLVNFPAHDTWPRRLMGMKWPFFLNVHLMYFTTASAKQLLEKCGYRMLEARPYFQTLQLGYVVERAANIVPLFRHVGKVVRWLGLGGLPFTYYMGQTLVTARKR